MTGPSNENDIQLYEDRLASIVRSVYTALQGDNLATAQRSSSCAHSSVKDELRSRFQTPRGRVTGGSPSMQGSMAPPFYTEEKYSSVTNERCRHTTLS